MKTNRINAPLTYKQTAPALRTGILSPELKKELDAARRPHPVRPQPVEKPAIVRVYICVVCRQGGGTLKNIGTHKAPRYIHHPPCAAMKEQEKKTAGGKA